MSQFALYLPYLKNKEKFLALRSELRAKRVEIDHWDSFRDVRHKLLSQSTELYKLTIDDFIRINSLQDGNTSFQQHLEECVKKLIPWRTGPFELCGVEIDSEWKSNLRWDRLRQFLPKLKDAIVADIGSGNGYFMFKMLEMDPKIIYGFDPQPRCVLQFELINSLLKEKRLLMEPLGIENMDVFSNYFDFVLCMGVIYHRRDPHTCLTKVKESMKPGATLIMETLVVEGDGEFSFSPPARYMEMRNVWFVPTKDCMCSWLEKTGFKDIEVLLEYDVGTEEQRRTEHSPDESLIDFLDPADYSKTIEGYKVPKRAIFYAKA